MPTYLTSNHTLAGMSVQRSVFTSTLTIENPTISGGGGTTTTTPGGSGATPIAQAVAYLWPRGDGTPAGT